jgi:hypothetical protein
MSTAETDPMNLRETLRYGFRETLRNRRSSRAYTRRHPDITSHDFSVPSARGEDIEISESLMAAALSTQQELIRRENGLDSEPGGQITAEDVQSLRFEASKWSKLFPRLLPDSVILDP